MDITPRTAARQIQPACTLPLTGKNVVAMIVNRTSPSSTRPDHQSPFQLVERAPASRR